MRPEANVNNQIIKATAAGVSLFAALFAASTGSAKPVEYNWSGFYVGIHGGAGFAEVDVTPGSLSPPGTAGTSFDADGALLGALAGYNFQSGNFIYGVEADVSFGGIEGENVTPTVPDLDIAWMASIRARAGVVLDSLLLFGSAGYGIADVESTEDHGTGVRGSSETQGGLVLGVGAEWAVEENLALRAEYQHGFYDEQRHSFPDDALHTHGIELDTDVARVALVWQFN